MCVYMCSCVVNVTQLTCIITHVMVTQGFGMMLMEEAERIAAEEHDSHKISVISGTCIYNVAPSSRLVQIFLYRSWDKKLLSKNRI